MGEGGAEEMRSKQAEEELQCWHGGWRNLVGGAQLEESILVIDWKVDLVLVDWNIYQ